MLCPAPGPFSWTSQPFLAGAAGGLESAATAGPAATTATMTADRAASAVRRGLRRPIVVSSYRESGWMLGEDAAAGAVFRPFPELRNVLSAASPRRSSDR